jgi:hypothetical protein
VKTDEQTLKDDVAFLRGLAQGGATATVKEGAILAAIGMIFGLVGAQYWAMDAGLLPAPAWIRPWLWLDGLVVFLIAIAVISSKFRGPPPGAASRALSAAWTGVGTALICADLGLVAAARRLSLPLLAPWVFPLILFTLIGAAWGVAFAVRRRKALALLAAGSFAAAVLCGVLMGRPEEWLALSGGLVLLLGVPGAVMARAAGRQG